MASTISDSGIESQRLDVNGSWKYQATGPQEPGEVQDKYLLMGRGYVDRYNFGAVEPIPENGSQLPREWTRPPIIIGKGYEIL